MRAFWCRTLLGVAVVCSSTPQTTHARVDKQDMSVTYGTYHKNPKNYDHYYYSRTSGYAITPIVIPPTVNQRPIILGPVQPYTDEQYAQIVEQSLGADTLQPGSARRGGRTIVEKQGDPLAATAYKRAQTRVIDVGDRGALRVETGEEVRLRGVRMMSEREPDEVRRFYGREGIRVLRELTQGVPVWVELQDPLRNRDGAVLGKVYLSDGTELGRYIMLQGLGRLAEEDFAESGEAAELADCEEAARVAKMGIWSLRNMW